MNRGASSVERPFIRFHAYFFVILHSPFAGPAKSSAKVQTEDKQGSA